MIKTRASTLASYGVDNKLVYTIVDMDEDDYYYLDQDCPIALRGTQLILLNTRHYLKLLK